MFGKIIVRFDARQPAQRSLNAPHAGRELKATIDALLGWLADALRVAAIDRDRWRMCCGIHAHLGPRLRSIARPRQSGRRFPQNESEIDNILRGVWDNLGRVAAEFAHIDRLQIFPPPRHEAGDIGYTLETAEGFERMRQDGKPALIFAAHLANWELPALIATKFALDATVLYRRPNIIAVSEAVIKIRKGSMGTLVLTSLDAPFKLAAFWRGTRGHAR